jgi:hypothetical protein
MLRNHTHRIRGRTRAPQPARPGHGASLPARPSPLTRAQIAVYRLGTFSTSSAIDVLRLYLLMRTTRTLAQAYKREIERSALARIVQLQKTAEVHGWPPPRPKSNAGNAARALVEEYLATNPERPVRDLGNSRALVEQYLATLVHEYDPLEADDLGDY